MRAADILLPLATAALGLLAWQLAVVTLGVPAVLLPEPGAVWARLATGWPGLLHDAGVTGAEALAAFGLSVLIGMGVAAAMTLRRGIRDALQPHLVLFQLVPKVAVGPLFITWFGIGWSSRIAFATFVSAFPVAIGALTGLGRIDRSTLQLLLAYRASHWQVFCQLRLPSALPYIFAGAKVSATMAFTGAVVGEFLSAQSGLGHAILNAASASDTALIFAALGLLCGSGVALYGAVAAVEAVVRARFGTPG